jgi:hypothetical protein
MPRTKKGAAKRVVIHTTIDPVINQGIEDYLAEHKSGPGKQTRAQVTDAAYLLFLTVKPEGEDNEVVD